MSALSYLQIQIQADAHDMGDDFGFETETVEILAANYNVPKEFVEQCLENNEQADCCNDEVDDSMDGDFDSAMASAGFGTDEDYGYYGEEC